MVPIKWTMTKACSRPARCVPLQDGAYIAASASTVLDNNGLAQCRSQALAQPARADIGDTTGTAGDDDVYGLARPAGALRLERGDRRGKGTQRARPSQNVSTRRPRCHRPPGCRGSM